MSGAPRGIEGEYFDISDRPSKCMGPQRILLFFFLLLLSLNIASGPLHSNIVRLHQASVTLYTVEQILIDNQNGDAIIENRVKD